MYTFHPHSAFSPSLSTREDGGEDGGEDFAGGAEDFSRGDKDLSGGGENFSREGVYANYSSSASRSSSAISQSLLASSPKSSRGSAAPLNTVTRYRIHDISNILKSGRGSLSGSFISR
jgi:hypothetical protein